MYPTLSAPNGSFKVFFGMDGSTDDTVLVIDIRTPLDDNQGSLGKHSFSLTKTAHGKWIPKDAKARARIVELLRPHFVAAGSRSEDGWIEASLNAVLNLGL